MIGSSDEPLHLPVQFCREVIQVWDECFKEGYVRVRYASWEFYTFADICPI